MSHPESLSQWIETVSTMFPKLSRPQAKVLAYWSFGMVLEKRVWHHAGVCGAGLATGLQRSQSAATLAGMVLRCQRQKRGQAPGIGREHVFWTEALVDPGLVARGSAATGLGLRCDDVEETLYRAGGKPGVSGLCHSGGVESGGRSRKGSLGAPLDEEASEVGG